MDQQTRTGGTYVVAVLLFMIAFIFLCMGIALVFSYPDKLALLGIVILGFSGIFIYSGIKNLKDAKLMAADADTQLKSVSAIRQTATDSKGNVQQTLGDIIMLAHWKYTNDEWNKFLKWERSRRKTSSTVEAILIIILGSLLLRSVRDASWIAAIGFSGAFAVIYWIGKYYISMDSFGKKKANEVVITTRSVIINGKVNTFHDGLYWLKKVQLIEENEITVIEFVYEWNTRKGPSSEEIRVPVPVNKIDEAREIANLY